ncbi:hypothetical protein ACQ4WX_47025 [Streptomyces lasalocidi]
MGAVRRGTASPPGAGRARPRPTFGGTVLNRAERSAGPVRRRFARGPAGRHGRLVRYVRAVATRYAGRITADELWVLAPSPHFFTGDAATPTRMTQRATAVIRRADLGPLSSGRRGGEALSTARR